MQKISLTRTVGADDPTTACEFLAKFSALSKSSIKEAMSKGAVCVCGEIRPPKGKIDFDKERFYRKNDVIFNKSKVEAIKTTLAALWYHENKTICDRRGYPIKYKEKI